MITLDLDVEYPDADTAKAVINALNPDNQGYVASELQGSRIVFRTEAKSAGTMRNTVDDLLACLKVAEESVGIASEKDRI